MRTDVVEDAFRKALALRGEALSDRYRRYATDEGGG